MGSHRYTYSDVVTAVAESTSIRQVLIKLGLAPKGGNYATMHRIITRLNLDTSHFLGKRNGKRFKKKPLAHYLVSYSTYSGTKLKERLLQEGVKDPVCECCSLHTWRNAPIPLEIHHVNGNSFDHRLSNIQLLCPNCHALTDTYRGRNISSP